MFCVGEFGGGYLDLLCSFFLFYISELKTRHEKIGSKEIVQK